MVIGGMRVSQLRELLVTLLVRRAGGTQRRWRAVLGPVRVHDVATHAHCNWSVAPSGSVSEIAQVEELLDTVRLEHPIVAPD